jgi:hypothetical protein
MQTDTLTIINLILYAVIIAGAFILKPLARGLDYYLLLGVILTIVIFVLSFFHANWLLWKRLLIAASYSAGSVIVWIIFFVVANFRIMTKLF